MAAVPPSPMDCSRFALGLADSTLIAGSQECSAKGVDAPVRLRPFVPPSLFVPRCFPLGSCWSQRSAAVVEIATKSMHFESATFDFERGTRWQKAEMAPQSSVTRPHTDRLALAVLWRELNSTRGQAKAQARRLSSAVAHIALLQRIYPACG